ncbi:MAG: fumarylacetoacetate hydrolase family protein [Pseudomonadota bacterium]
MRLVTFTHGGATRTGALRGEEIVDLNATDSTIPNEMVALLQGGDAMLAKAAAAAKDGAPLANVSEVKLESPILTPPKILAVGLNYVDHFNEMPEAIQQRLGGKPPTSPVIFNKQNTSTTGPYDVARRPIESTMFDYEAELGVVIGKTCRRVPKDKAFDVIAGYTVVNDLTVRDWQRASPTMTMGKSWDSHCPMGPAIVTKDEVSDPEKLAVTCTVDGDVRQNFNTGEMLFDIASLIEYLSTAFTLTPGDVIVTGTSAGVALFAPGEPYLKDGQTCRVEIAELGYIENVIELDEGVSFIR